MRQPLSCCFLNPQALAGISLAGSPYLGFELTIWFNPKKSNALPGYATPA